MSKKLILASSSPRRQELLQQVGIPYSVRTETINESSIIITNPIEKVEQLAILKGKSIPFHSSNEVILSADTVVSFNENIFEKPKNKEEAYEMITSLSGTTHEVLTGVMIRSTDHEEIFVAETKVEFWPLTEQEINWYINTNDPYDKAGGYGIQSLGSIFVKQIIGDYYNVVGLPLSRVVRELRAFGITPLK